MGATNTDTWLGLNAAHSLAVGDYYDTFVGSNAGYYNYSGTRNTFIGSYAGYFNRGFG
jgi:hypothetical protein